MTLTEKVILEIQKNCGASPKELQPTKTFFKRRTLYKDCTISFYNSVREMVTEQSKDCYNSAFTLSEILVHKKGVLFNWDEKDKQVTCVANRHCFRRCKFNLPETNYKYYIITRLRDDPNC